MEAGRGIVQLPIQETDHMVGITGRIVGKEVHVGGVGQQPE